MASTHKLLICANTFCVGTFGVKLAAWAVYNKTMKARDLWFKILDSQIETGTPYITYKDSVNRKSNQQNLGTIKSSNLC